MGEERRRKKANALHTDARLRDLYASGARFVIAEQNGTWGVAGRTLDILLLRLRGSEWARDRLRRIGRNVTWPVADWELQAALERLSKREVSSDA